VNASIQGRRIDDVFVVPNLAIREGAYVYLSKAQRLQRAAVKIIWQDQQNSLISSGLVTGDMVVTTSLNSSLLGAKVMLAEPLVASPDKRASPKPVTDVKTNSTP
jgi:hypothetical protein